MIAQMESDYQASRLLWLRAAWLKNEGRRNTRETGLAKWFATVASERAASDAVQIHGANGYSDEYPVGRFYRNSKGARHLRGYPRNPQADAGRLRARVPHRQAAAMRAPAVPVVIRILAHDQSARDGWSAIDAGDAAAAVAALRDMAWSLIPPRRSTVWRSIRARRRRAKGVRGERAGRRISRCR